jgi:predicted hydrocarbon binding protein/DNA-binding transcriptional ArsR family regulator
MVKSDDHTALFSTNHGFIALNSPVKLKILELLNTGSKSFDEVVRYTGKAKSTISVHLNDLKSYDLVDENIGSKDKRKKTYFLNTRCMACSQKPIPNNYDNVLQKVASSTEDQYDFLQSIFQAVKFGFEAHGINHRPIIKKIGTDVGTCISTNFGSSDMDGVLDDIMVFWKSHKLGYVSIVDTEPLTIIVDECFVCKSMPTVGKTLCSFEEGLFEGIFSGKLGLECKIKEMECYGTGHDHCLFVMQE